MSDLSPTRIDHVTAILKGMAGAVPLAGGVIAEIIGTLIPNQRVDRLSSFVAILDGKLREVDQQVLEQKARTEEFADLLEDGLRQATRSLSEERRRYIASVLKNSLTSDETKHLEQKRILELLGELNDAEIILLEWERGYVMAHPFNEIHREVLFPEQAARTGLEHQRISAFQSSYRGKLRQMGLLRPRFDYRRRDETNLPEFDRETGTLASRGDELTHLGMLLLDFIDAAENIPAAERG